MAALALPASAPAAYFAGTPVDGPSPAIQSLGGLDVALDGTGALTYVKTVDFVDHIMASQLIGGVWQTPVLLDGSLTPAGSQPVVAAANGGRAAVIFASAGHIYAVVDPGGVGGWSVPMLLGDGFNPSVSMTGVGAAYATWTGPGATSPDNVYAAEMARTDNVFTPIPGTIDVDPSQKAGDGARRSRIIAADDGSAIATWGEMGADGRSHVYVRRIVGTTLSLYPQDATLSVEPGTGAAAAGADSPVIGVRDDSSFAWLAFRQDFADGSHIVQRPLVGSLLDPPQILIGAENSATPRIVVNSVGDGLATSSGADDNAVLANVLHDMVFQPLQRLDTPPGAILPTPIPTFPDSGFPTVSWIQDPKAGDGLATVHSRQWEISPSKRLIPAPDPDNVVSNPALGPVDPDLGFDASGDRIGDIAIGFVQGTAANRSIEVATFDRPPASFALSTSQNFKKTQRPTLVWAKSLDLWGPITYSVVVGGVSIGSTQATTLTPAAPIADGAYTWSVVASDERGQTLNSRATQQLRIDTTPPKATVGVLGNKRVGQLITFTVRARDVLPTTAKKPTTPTPTTPTTPTAPTTPAPASRVSPRRPHQTAPVAPKGSHAPSGIKRITLRYGDGSLPVKSNLSVLTHRHTYQHAGLYPVTVVVTDKAGASLTIIRRISIGT